jgi:hypothetical protein
MRMKIEECLRKIYTLNSRQLYGEVIHPNENMVFLLPLSFSGNITKTYPMEKSGYLDGLTGNLSNAIRKYCCRCVLSIEGYVRNESATRS